MRSLLALAAAARLLSLRGAWNNATEAVAPGAGPVANASLCEVPVDMRNHTEGMTLLSASYEYVIFADDGDGEDTTLFLYDCRSGKRLLFVHIPKNAGSTIEDLAFGSGVKWGRHFQPHPNTLPDGNTCSGWHTPPAYLPYPNPYEGAEVFCVTRDPTDRLLSEYRYLLSVKWGDNNPRLRTAPECSELGLNNFVSQTLTLMQQGQTFISDCHFTPQSMFIWGPNKQWCKNVVRIKDLPDGFNNLMDSKGYFAVKLGKQKHNSKADKCENLSVNSFWPETKNLIKQVYAQDFAKLNYPAPL
jgi:hypothetical protein